MYINLALFWYIINLLAFLQETFSLIFYFFLLFVFQFYHTIFKIK